MNNILGLAMTAMLTATPHTKAQTMIGPNHITLQSDLMTPEALWAMGRIGGSQASPDGKQIVYQVAYYSVAENKSHTMLYVMDANGNNKKQLTTDTKSESDASWIDNGQRIAFIRDGQVWSMKNDGSDRKQLSHSDIDIEGYRFSPDNKRVVLIKSLPYYGTIKKNPSDLPKATGRIVTDMNYRHWDHYVESMPHPFVAEVTANGINAGVDIMQGEPFESPLAPFGGIEQIAWSPDSRQVAYTSRKKEGTAYAISTDADIYVYDLATGKTKNLCKPEGYKEPAIDATKSMKHQAVNHQAEDVNPGYDVNPKFPPTANT